MTSALATSLLALILVTQVIFTVALPPYLFDGYGAEDFPVSSGGGSVVGSGGGSGVGENDVSMDRMLQGLNKRSCIRRGSRCDHRPDDCCSGGACRCNLWGANCQCQRMGIFQKWG